MTTPVDSSAMSTRLGGSPTLTGHLAVPTTPGPWPGVVAVHEALGVDDVTLRQAERLAAAGYLVRQRRPRSGSCVTSFKYATVLKERGMSQPATPAGPTSGSTRIECRDGDHLIEVRERELIARRLLKTSRKHSFDPDRDVDWDAEPDPGTFYMSPHLLSLYETPMWDRLTDEQRVELSRREWCSIMSFGVTAEVNLMSSLLGHASGLPYEQAHWSYALIEVEDECRHSRMFARAIETFGLRPLRPHWWQRLGGRVGPLISDPLAMFAGALVVEEFTDAFQRLMMSDETVHPITRQTSRIHVIEEARHITYAREELKRQVARRSAARRRAGGYVLAQAVRLLLATAIHPSCYSAVGLDPAQARSMAGHSPHRRQVEQWALAKCARFFHQTGLMDGPAEAVWAKARLLPPELRQARR